MNEKRKNWNLYLQVNFTSQISSTTLKLCFKQNHFFPTSAPLSLLAMSLATLSVPAKYCSSLRSNVHAKAQRESQVLVGRASISQKGIFHHFKTVGNKLLVAIPKARAPMC
ncbi:hypothetical protein [Lactococcus lactis]|uniref:hypothetical protein n=1 Tax=Lactococcus lactis TaxID=1358 RepID=UPI0021A90DEE|nr:hypothetical protein [Lactococcus lactis]